MDHANSPCNNLRLCSHLDWREHPDGALGLVASDASRLVRAATSCNNSPLHQDSRNGRQLPLLNVVG
jgi:hypothetical protein